MNVKTQAADSLTVYELFILAITLIVMVLWLIFFLFSIDSQTKSITIVLDSALCLFFLADFLYCTYRAENRRHYFLHRGWLDLLGSVPVLLILRPFRLARAIQIIKKITHSGKHGVWNLYRSDISSSAAEMQAVDATITSSGDALWWAISTVATVGYGDVVPVTDNGRRLGAILMTLGVMFVSVLTSYITTKLFILKAQTKPKIDEKNRPIMQRFDQLEQELAEMKQLLAEQADRK
jgi:voltage-gated potassium channel